KECASFQNLIYISYFINLYFLSFKMEHKIYPVIKSEEETKEFINNEVDKALQKSRIKEMLEKKAALEKDLKHYKKLKSTWNRIDL
ncbi:MAG: hypothetical protein LH629_07480, partial [Ignavibacteria bacterium]|nr:hypothetical protein [Ignavibacteria bacterium]